VAKVNGKISRGTAMSSKTVTTTEFTRQTAPQKQVAPTMANLRGKMGMGKSMVTLWL